MEQKHKGAHSELTACAWLLRQGYEVFRNVSQHGLIDIIAIKDGKTLLLDVKSGPSLASVSVSPEQAASGVGILFVDNEQCIIVDSPRVRGAWTERNCSYCEQAFMPQGQKGSIQKFCSDTCRSKSYYDAHRRSLVSETQVGAILVASSSF
jgi:hypothetical protein